MKFLSIDLAATISIKLISERLEQIAKFPGGELVMFLNARAPMEKKVTKTFGQYLGNNDNQKMP